MAAIRSAGLHRQLLSRCWRGFLCGGRLSEASKTTRTRDARQTDRTLRRDHDSNATNQLAQRMRRDPKLYYSEPRTVFTSGWSNLERKNMSSLDAKFYFSEGNNVSTTVSCLLLFIVAIEISERCLRNRFEHVSTIANRILPPCTLQPREHVVLPACLLLVGKGSHNEIHFCC